MAGQPGPVEVEIERAGELLLVDVGRTEPQMQERARRHLDSLEDLVLGGGAGREPVRGRAHPHSLLGEGTHLRSIVAQSLEDAGVLAQQLGLLLQRVLSRLETADDHRMHDPCDLEVGELAVERLVVDVAQEADHVVLTVEAFRPRTCS